MGFSLRRALAGAVAGGAGAAVQLADNAIKAAEHDRQQADAFARQKELMQMQEESIIRREGAVLDLKEKREAKRKESIGTFMKEGLAALKEAKIDSGSIEGQRKLAEMAAANGHQDYADKFYDNAIKLGQIESTAESNRESRQVRLETARLAREGRGGSDHDDREDERGLAYAGRVGSRIKVPSRDGKDVAFASGGSYMESLYQEARDGGLSVREARNLVADTQVEINKGLAKNPGNPDAVAESALSIARKAWAPVKAPVKQESQSIVPPATPAPEKKYVPSATGFGQSSASGTNTPLVAKIPY